MGYCIPTNYEIKTFGAGIIRERHIFLKHPNHPPLPKLPSTTIGTVGERDFRHRCARLVRTRGTHTSIGWTLLETGG